MHVANLFRIYATDVWNLDEVRMSLTGSMDLKMRSLVDCHRDNEVRRSPFTSNDYKRMCTVLLSAQNLPKVSYQPMRPVIIFKVTGSRAEVAQYDTGVMVTHQTNGVVHTQ